jgi:hypothetical protein
LEVLVIRRLVPWAIGIFVVYYIWTYPANFGHLLLLAGGAILAACGHLATAVNSL